MKSATITLILILSMSLVLATNGTGTLNISDNTTFDIVEGNITFSNASFFGTGNFNTSGLIISSSSLKNCTTIKGNFTIKKMSTGTERNVSGILDDAIQMTSYEGDFYKHPEFNITESYVSYSRMIASEGFLNESKCNKIFLGMRVEEEVVQKKYWFFWTRKETRLIFNPIVSYVCKEKLNEVEYCT